MTQIMCLLVRLSSRLSSHGTSNVTQAPSHPTVTSSVGASADGRARRRDSAAQAFVVTVTVRAGTSQSSASASEPTGPGHAVALTIRWQPASEWAAPGRPGDRHR